jgi:hypothetical protein
MCDFVALTNSVNSKAQVSIYHATPLSPFGAANYYPISFNDIPSGMVTLFEFLVVNKYDVRRAGSKHTGIKAILGSKSHWDQTHTGIKATLGSKPHWDQTHTGIKAIPGSKPYWDQSHTGNKPILGSNLYWHQTILASNPYWDRAHTGIKATHTNTPRPSQSVSHTHAASITADPVLLASTGGTPLPLNPARGSWCVLGRIWLRGRHGVRRACSLVLHPLLLGGRRHRPQHLRRVRARYLQLARVGLRLARRAARGAHRLRCHACDRHQHGAFW